MLTPGITVRNSIQADMAHGLNIFPGRIREGRGPLSNCTFLLLTGVPSRIRLGQIFSPTRKLEAKQNHRNQSN